LWKTSIRAQHLRNGHGGHRKSSLQSGAAAPRLGYTRKPNLRVEGWSMVEKLIAISLLLLALLGVLALFWAGRDSKSSNADETED
jgi:hypothetical protein